MAGKFSDDYKEMVIELILEGKKSQNQIGRELGIPRSTLSGWMAKYHSNPKEDIKKALKPSEAELEVKKMKKEIKDLQEENEILKKAAAFFAKNQKL